MCFWGEALVLGPNINLPMSEQAVAPAFAAVQKAETLAAAASPREQMLIAALSARYTDDAKADRKPLDAAYAAAMEKVARKFPDDDEIAVLYAESVMDVSPWNYWQPGGHEPTPQAAPIVPTLERVLARNPGHPGAAHFYIHAVEASDRPQRAEPFADRMRGSMPAAGHVVHMPSHIYYRVGRYLDALSVNKTAAAVDETYLAATDAPMGVYRLGYYPHNVHFMTGVGDDGGRRRGGDRRSRKAAQSHPRRGRTRHRHGPSDQGGAVFRARPIQRARHHPGAARSGRRHSLRAGDVALRAFARRHRQGRLYRAPKPRPTRSPASPTGPISRRCWRSAFRRSMS